MLSHPDQHYRDIAELARGQRTGHAKIIAEMYGVPVTTVHGWIRRARQKGFLEEATDMPCRCCGGTGKARPGLRAKVSR